MNTWLTLRSKVPVEHAIRDARIKKSKIDEVVMVGGSIHTDWNRERA